MNYRKSTSHGLIISGKALITLSLLLAFFGRSHAQGIQADSMLKSTDTLQLRSIKFTSYNWGTARSTTISTYYWHQYRLGQNEWSWVGLYGGKVRPYLEGQPDKLKYLNRFRAMTIVRHFVLPMALASWGYVAYQEFYNDEFLETPEQIGAFSAGMVTTSITMAIPFFKSRTLRKIGGG